MQILDGLAERGRLHVELFGGGDHLPGDDGILLTIRVEIADGSADLGNGGRLLVRGVRDVAAELGEAPRRCDDFVQRPLAVPGKGASGVRALDDLTDEIADLVGGGGASMG